MKTTLLVTMLAACAKLALAQDIPMQEHAGLRFVCGGVGAEERAALAALRPQANLELLFVTAKRGGYLADVEVTVYAADKSSPALQTTAGGPLCLLSAPAAKYRIDASYGGVKRSAQVVAGKKLVRVVLGFPEEPWDGIKASGEEKQQAREK